MADIPKLLAQLPEKWIALRGALDELAKLPPATKRDKVYPRVVELVVEYWCVKEEPSAGGFEIEAFVKFMLSELAVEPELANMVFTQMGKRRPTRRLNHFYTFASEARDRRAAPLLEGLWNVFPYHWAEAVIAIDGHELADDVAALLSARPQQHERDVGPAAGLYGGTKRWRSSASKRSPISSRDRMASRSVSRSRDMPTPCTSRRSARATTDCRRSGCMRHCTRSRRSDSPRSMRSRRTSTSPRRMSRPACCSRCRGC